MYRPGFGGACIFRGASDGQWQEARGSAPDRAKGGAFGIFHFKSRICGPVASMCPEADTMGANTS